MCAPEFESMNGPNSMAASIVDKLDLVRGCQDGVPILSSTIEVRLLRFEYRVRLRPSCANGSNIKFKCSKILNLLSKFSLSQFMCAQQLRSCFSFARPSSGSKKARAVHTS